MIIQSSSSDGTAIVLELNGDLKFKARISFHQAIKDARATGAKSIILNMKNVLDIDSAGLAFLRNAYEELNVAGVSINFRYPQGKVLKLLELTKITAIIPIL